MSDTESELSTLDKLHSETAKISWVELQRFFAQGVVLRVADELDLVATAALFAEDDTLQLEPLINTGQVAAPSDDQARIWFEGNVTLWSVVVAPFVLVQKPKIDKG